MKKLKQAIILMSLVVISAISLYACGGTPTATPVQPTATVAAVAAPTDTTAAVAAPTDTTAAVVAPTDTTSAATAPTATTASTSGNGGGGVSGDAINLLQQSSTAMKSVKSFHIILKSSTSGVDTSGEGDVALPDMMRLTLTTTAGMEQLIIISNTTYVQVPGSDAYYQTAGGSSTLSTTEGASSLGDIADSASVVGDETLDGVDTTHIKFSYSLDKAADQAAQASGLPNATPSTGLGEANAEVWIEKSTGYIHQFSSDTTTAGTESSTTVTFSKFNEDVNPPIVAPTNVQQLPSVPTVAAP